MLCYSVSKSWEKNDKKRYSPHSLGNLDNDRKIKLKVKKQIK